MRFFTKFVTTFCFVGYFPIGAGTLASAITTLLIYTFISNSVVFVSLGVIFVVLGFLFCGKSIPIFGRGDPKQVVIDEVAGTFVALFLIPLAFKAYLIAFLLFRAFDIVKPSPIRNVEKIKGSAGIMLDDLLAGLFANITCRIILIFI